MKVAGFAGTLLTLTFLLHLIVWRIRLPKAQTRTLLLLFLGALPLGLALNAALPTSWPLRIEGFWQYVHVCFVHIAMSLAYIEFYTGIEGDSPSLTMLLFVEQAGDTGRSEEEMHQLIESDSIIGRRLRAMIDVGMVTCAGDIYRLTWSGRAWARLFHLARCIWRLPVGG